MEIKLNYQNVLSNQIGEIMNNWIKNFLSRNTFKVVKNSKGSFNLEIKRSQEIKPVEVRFGDEEHNYEFKHAIIHGVENKENGKLMSLIYGYTDVNDFLMVYTNIMVECYNFLKENYIDDEEFDVLKVLKEYSMNVFDGIERGEFSDSQLNTVRDEF